MRVAARVGHWSAEIRSRCAVRSDGRRWRRRFQNGLPRRGASVQLALRSDDGVEEQQPQGGGHQRHHGRADEDVDRIEEMAGRRRQQAAHASTWLWFFFLRLVGVQPATPESCSFP